MKNVDVLIVVDVEGALAGALDDNVYMIDTNKHVGSGNEGQRELQTACVDGQIITWQIAPVSASSDVEITGFTGQMIDDKICVPQQVTVLGNTYWEGRVEAQGVTGSQQYSVVLTADGKAMSFDPYLVIGA
jgi:hypothetical protein